MNRQERIEEIEKAFFGDPDDCNYYLGRSLRLIKELDAERIEAIKEMAKARREKDDVLSSATTDAAISSLKIEELEEENRELDTEVANYKIGCGFQKQIMETGKREVARLKEENRKLREALDHIDNSLDEASKGDLRNIFMPKET